MQTTVTTMRYAFHYLINNPRVQEKIHAEIDQKLAKRVRVIFSIQWIIFVWLGYRNDKRWFTDARLNSAIIFFS